MRFALAKNFVGETLSEERFTEDSFTTVQDQVSRFLNLGVPISNPDFYDIDENKGQTDELINPFPVYGSDPVDVVKHAQFIEKVVNSTVQNNSGEDSSKSEVTTSDSLPQGSSPNNALAGEALKD